VLVEGTLSHGGVVPPTLVLLDGEGRPEQDIVLPADFAYELATSGAWIVLESQGSTFSLVRVQDGALFSFRPDLHLREKPDWTPGFSPDGRELWLLDARSLQLHRFALPE